MSGVSKSFTPEQNRNALRHLRRIVHERFEGHHTKAAEAMGVSQPLVSGTLANGTFGMKLLLGMSRLTDMTMDQILGGDGSPDESLSAEEQGRAEFLRVYRGEELSEAQQYLEEEGERAMRMAGTWSPAQFRDHFVRGFTSWREVGRVGANTPEAVAKVHDSRATALPRDAKKGPKRAAR